MRGSGGEVRDAEQEQMKRERGIYSNDCGRRLSSSNSVEGSVLCFCLKERGDFLAATGSSSHFFFSFGLEWRLTKKR
jgi:hypothetical protein